MHTDTSKKAPVTNQGKDAAGNYAAEGAPKNKDIRSKEEGFGGPQKASEKPADKQTAKPHEAMDGSQHGKEVDKGGARKDQPRS